MIGVCAAEPSGRFLHRRPGGLLSGATSAGWDSIAVTEASGGAWSSLAARASSGAQEATDAPASAAARPPTDARWLVWLLAREMLPESWLPPAEIQELRDKTRLRKALAEDRTRWAQRLQAFLLHEGWPCGRGRLLTATGRRWLSGLALAPAARAQVERLLRLIDLVEDEQRELERELRRFARSDRRCQALETIYGIGPILACHILAELGEAKRFRRARSAMRAAGLDPVVDESGETKRRGHLAKHGSPELRWALVQAAHQARYGRSPDRPLYQSIKARRKATQPAVLTIARKLARRSYHLLDALEQAA